MNISIISRCVRVCVVLLITPAVRAGGLQVVSVEPAPRSLDAGWLDPIVIEFDRPLDAASVVLNQSIWAFGRWSGTLAGALALSNGDHTVTLTPSTPLSAGETVMVILSHDIQAQDTTFLRAAGYSFQYWTRALPASLEFTEIQRLCTTDTCASNSTRAYGGIGSDLDNDGFLDITVVNEDTLDLRVFMNLGTGTGVFDSNFVEPTFPVGLQASPNEPSDFDRDGNVDIAVANPAVDTVSILLGQGDGTYGPQQVVNVGDQPRGLTVLDVDGDGDTDIVTANFNSSNMSLMINDGSGVFGVASFFEGGGSGEWALATADMNEDGILDLIVGARNDQAVIVHTGNGDGTFTQRPSQSSGGASWMMNYGDVNGDGHEDIALANSFSNNGAILLGDGSGQLGPPTTYPTDPFALASDLGDLDGDGDLDWVTSSFSGDWFLFLNDGNGNYTFETEFDATIASSCALLMDIDNDRDLDLALIDEIQDEVIVLSNAGIPVPAAGTTALAGLCVLLTGAGWVLIRLRRRAA